MIWRSNTITSKGSSSCVSLVSSPFSSIPVRYELCWLTGKIIQAFQIKKPEETSKHLLPGAQENQRLVAEQDQVPCGPTGFSRHGNCPETETGMIPAYHASRQPFQTILQSTLWRVGDAAVGRKMLDRQRQRVDIPAHYGQPQKEKKSGR